MRSIKFSDSDLNFLRLHYEEELKAARDYIVRVEEILKKLGASEKPSINVLPEKEVKVAKKRGRKPGKKLSVDTPVKEKKKPGRKPKAFLVSTEVKAEPEPKAPESKKEAKMPVKRALKTKQSKPIVEKKEPAGKPEKSIPAANETKIPIKNRNKKPRPRKGVFLTPLSKPLKKKEPVDEASIPPSEPPVV
jgi:hypothetical protein